MTHNIKWFAFIQLAMGENGVRFKIGQRNRASDDGMHPLEILLRPDIDHFDDAFVD